MAELAKLTRIFRSRIPKFYMKEFKSAKFDLILAVEALQFRKTGGEIVLNFPARTVARLRTKSISEVKFSDELKLSLRHFAHHSANFYTRRKSPKCGLEFRPQFGNRLTGLKLKHVLRSPIIGLYTLQIWYSSIPPSENTALG